MKAEILNDEQWEKFIDEINNPTKNEPKLMSKEDINEESRKYKWSQKHKEYIYLGSTGGMIDYDTNIER